MNDTLMYIFAAIGLVLAVSRVVRLVTFDDFPPMARIREAWDVKTAGSAWNELLHCPYCFGYWASGPAVILAAGFLFGWPVLLTMAGIFWVLVAWFAVGYLAGIIVASNWG